MARGIRGTSTDLPVLYLEEPLPSLRIGYAPDYGYLPVQSDVTAVVDEAVKVFEAAGHRVVAADEGPPPTIRLRRVAPFHKPSKADVNPGPDRLHS